MNIFLAGQWQERSERLNVTNPANGELIDTVPIASADDVELAMMLNWRWKHSAPRGPLILPTLILTSRSLSNCARFPPSNSSMVSHTIRRALPLIAGKNEISAQD